MKQIIFVFLVSLGSAYSQKSAEMAGQISLGDSIVKIQQSFGKEGDNILFINVHEDEVTSIETVEHYAQEYPLNFVRLVHAKTRNISFSLNGKQYEIDPNRIYTRKGRKATLKSLSNYSWSASRAVKKLASVVVEKITDEKVIVAMHNNTDVNYSIKSYEAGGDEAANTAKVYVNPEMDPDDFIYTTVPAYYEAFVAKKINVILQDNESCVDDGSLSVYCGKRNIPYINIEAQKGHFDEQLELIKVTLEVLAEVK